MTERAPADSQLSKPPGGLPRPDGTPDGQGGTYHPDPEPSTNQSEVAWRRAFALALWDAFVFWSKVELTVGAFQLLRGIWRWGRSPLREREQLLWTKFVYEVISGYGEGETEGIFQTAGVPYPRWFPDKPPSHWTGGRAARDSERAAP